MPGCGRLAASLDRQALAPPLLQDSSVTASARFKSRRLCPGFRVTGQDVLLKLALLVAARFHCAPQGEVSPAAGAASKLCAADAD